jgi:hypothetical protein
MLRENKVEMYREDNNCNAAALWAHLDRGEGENRHGITECKFISGHYKMWDDIIACTLSYGGCGFVDSCASGGGRNDLESLRRGVPLLRSDSDRCAISHRLSMTTAFSKWIPFNGAGGIEDNQTRDAFALAKADLYSARASYFAALNINKLLPTQDPVTQISIIQSGRAGGFTLSPPVEDKSYMSKLGMEEEIVSLLGGRVAEKLILNDISTGASNDIQRATEIARGMITKYGMSDKLGPVVYGSGGGEVFLGRDFSNTPNYSEKVAAMIDEETLAIVNAAFEKAVQILNANMEKLHFVASFLMEHEVMDEDQFAASMEEGATAEKISSIKEEKLKKSIDENAKKREADAEKKASELAEMLANEAAKAAKLEEEKK